MAEQVDGKFKSQTAMRWFIDLSWISKLLIERSTSNCLCLTSSFKPLKIQVYPKLTPSIHRIVPTNETQLQQTKQVKKDGDTSF